MGGGEDVRDRAISFRAWKASDVPSVARLHREGLRGSFLPELGIRFLETMYELLWATPEVFGFVAEEEGSVAGFICCTVSRKATDRTLRRRKILLLGKALPALLRRPARIVRLLSGGGYAKKPHKTEAELLAVVVRDEKRSRGIGRGLLQLSREEFRRREVDDYCVVVAEENIRAVRFYEKNGLVRQAVVEVFGRPMVELYERLGEGSGPEKEERETRDA